MNDRHIGRGIVVKPPSAIRQREVLVLETLRNFLIAAGEHSAAMYDMGFATGAKHPQGPAQRNLEDAASAYVKAQKALMDSLS